MALLPRERGRPGVGDIDARRREAFLQAQAVLSGTGLVQLSKRCLDPGEALFSPLRQPGEAYLVGEGRIRVFAVSQAGREVVFWEGQMGDLVGVADVLGSGEAVSFATAKVSSTVFRIPAEFLAKRIREDPAVAELVVGHLANRLCRARASILAASTASVPSRLAHLLMVLSEDSRRLEDGSLQLVTRYSQQELADMIGASRQSVSEAMAELQRAGFLKRSGGRLTIAASR